jgi:hypothetical protein
MKMFKNKMILGMMLVGSLNSLVPLALAKKPAEEQGRVEEAQPKAEAEEIQGGVQMEEYVPKVIIEAKWQKIKEKLVPHEWDPGSGIISCGTEIQGRFGEGTVSFGSYDYSIGGESPVVPRSITLDEEENLYILDPVNFRVLKFDRNGNYLSIINLQRVKPKEGHMGKFDIAEGCWIGEKERIYVDQNGCIYLCNVRDAWGNLKTLKFSKAGRFIGTKSLSFEKEGYTFTSNIQAPNKGIVQVIDQKKNIKLLEMPVNLTTKLANQGYELENIGVIGEDEEKNLYIKIIATKTTEKPQFEIYNKEQVHKYSSQGKHLFIFPEKENHYRFRDEITSTTVVTGQGTIYDMVVIWEEEQEKKSLTYKLSPTDRMLKEIEDIDEFLRQMREQKSEAKKITLYTNEGGFKLPREIKIIKWEKEK